MTLGEFLKFCGQRFVHVDLILPQNVKKELTILCRSNCPGWNTLQLEKILTPSTLTQILYFWHCWVRRNRDREGSDKTVEFSTICKWNRYIGQAESGLWCAAGKLFTWIINHRSFLEMLAQPFLMLTCFWTEWNKKNAWSLQGPGIILSQTCTSEKILSGSSNT